VKHRLHGVQNLNLSHNEIEEIDGDTFIFPNLEVLDLSHNRLHTIVNGGMFLGRLHTLKLQRNAISSLRWLHCDMRLPLAVLDVEFNQIKTISDIAEIVNLKNLEKFNVSSNPLEGDLSVEAFCMLGCPQLTHLNGQVVTDVARTRARQWCEENSSGAAILDYVHDLHAYYTQPSMQVEASPAMVAPKHFPKSTPSVKDPLGYLQQSTVALDYLMQAARRRKHCRTKRQVNSTMPLSFFEDRHGEIKIMPWKQWSDEMRRIGRRVQETRAAIPC